MGPPPDKLKDKIGYYICLYTLDAVVLLFLGLCCVMYVYDIVKKWLVDKLAPKHRDLNWLRRRAGIQLK